MTFDEWMEREVDGLPQYRHFRASSAELRAVWNAATEQFNRNFQHDPPKVGDTRWIRVAYAGRQAPRPIEFDDDWMTD